MWVGFPHRSAGFLPGVCALQASPCRLVRSAGSSAPSGLTPGWEAGVCPRVAFVFLGTSVLAWCRTWGEQAFSAC